LQCGTQPRKLSLGHAATRSLLFRCEEILASHRIVETESRTFRPQFQP